MLEFEENHSFSFKSKLADTEFHARYLATGNAIITVRFVRSIANCRKENSALSSFFQHKPCHMNIIQRNRFEENYLNGQPGGDRIISSRLCHLSFMQCNVALYTRNIPRYLYPGRPVNLINCVISRSRDNNNHGSLEKSRRPC